MDIFDAAHQISEYKLSMFKFDARNEDERIDDFEECLNRFLDELMEHEGQQFVTEATALGEMFFEAILREIGF